MQCKGLHIIRLCYTFFKDEKRLIDMKKISLIFLTVILVGCTSIRPLRNIITNASQFSTPLNQTSLTVDDKKDAYYIYESNLYKYDIQKKETSQLQTSDSLLGPFMDSFDLIYYDHYLYGIVYNEHKQATSKYSIVRVDYKGSNIEEVIPLDETPVRFRIDNGKVYFLIQDEYNTTYILNTYDNDFELINTETYDLDTDIYSFYHKNGEIVIPESSDILYESFNKKIGYNIYDLNEELDGTKVVGYIETDTLRREYEDKVVVHVSSQYYYVNNLNGIQTYYKYDDSGNLVDSITPSEFISSQGSESAMFWYSDFSMIDKVVDDEYIYGHSADRIFICELTSHTCHYLNGN